MRNISYLNVDESIERRKLLYKEGVLDKIDFFLYIFMSAVFTYFLYSSYKDLENNNQNELIFNFLLFLVAVFSYYLLYRKFDEYRLKKIETDNSRAVNKQKIIQYAASKGYELYRNSADCIILNEDTTSSSYCITIIILLKNSDVFFTVIRDGFKTNTPTIISHIFIKNDLKKILTKSL